VTRLRTSHLSSHQESNLNVEHILCDTLPQCAPSEDEARLLAAFRRNDAALAGLADAELFCLDLMTVGTPAVDQSSRTNACLH